MDRLLIVERNVDIKASGLHILSHESDITYHMHSTHDDAIQVKDGAG